MACEVARVFVYGLEESLHASSYPMKVGEPSWDEDLGCLLQRGARLGNAKSGAGHDNFLKGIIVQFDLKYPRYLSPQLQRYTWFNIVSSQSTMHRLTSQKNIEDCFDKHTSPIVIAEIKSLLHTYENVAETVKPLIFKQLVSSLPSSYTMWMRVSTNYLQLKTMYRQRRTHKLDEWQYLCDWMETLPYFKELCLTERGNK